MRLSWNTLLGSGYLLIDPETGAGAYKIAGGSNGSSTVVSDVIDKLTQIIGFGAGLLDLFFQSPISDGVSKAIGWISGLISVVGAFLSCSGSDIFVVLVPLLLATVWTLILGPLGLGLALYLRFILGAIIGLAAAKGAKELTRARCN